MKDENAMYVARTDPFGLAQEVSDMRSRGWEPVGGATAAKNKIGEQVFIQLMTMPFPTAPDTRTQADPMDATKLAAAKPKEERTVADVLLLQSSVFGCCDRHTNNSGCDCKREAERRRAKLLFAGQSSEHPSCAPGSYAGPDHRELHKEEAVDVGRKAEQIHAERIKLEDDLRATDQEGRDRMKAIRARLLGLQERCPHQFMILGTCPCCGGWVDATAK